MFELTEKWVLTFFLLCFFGISNNEVLAKGGHGGHHGHHGGHHGHHHHDHHHNGHHHDHWHHAHHNDWWHHDRHPGWEHNHHGYWNTWHHPMHDWYWYGAGVAGVAGLGLVGAQLDYPGYYYDPNYYYLQDGVPSVEYQYDEPNDQAPSEESLKAISVEQTKSVTK